MLLLSGNEIRGPAYRVRCHSFGIWHVLIAEVLCTREARPTSRASGNGLIATVWSLGKLEFEIVAGDGRGL